MSVETMTTILEVMLVMVCIITTAFPVWYGFFNRWWTTRAGKSMMGLSTGVALAWDLTGYLYFWPPDSIEQIEVYFWIQFGIFAYTMIAGLYVLYALWYNRRHGQMVTVRYRSTEEDEHDNDGA